MLRLITLIACLFALAAALRPMPVMAGEYNPVPEADYWRAIAAIEALAAAEISAPTVDAPASFGALADELASISAVELNRGRVIPIDHSFLLAQLRSTPPDVESIQSRADALLAAQIAQGSPVFSETNVASLAPILARPEFRYLPPELPGFLRKLAEMRDRFFRWLGGLLPEWTVNIPPALGQLLTIIATVLLAAVIAYVLAKFAGEFTAEARPRSDEDDHGVPLTADAALDRAQEFSAGGDYRTAVRYLYLSTLLLMEERGLLRYDRSLTNREYLRRVAHDPTLSVTLQDVVDVFDRVWYGYQPLDESTYQRYADTVETLKRYR